LLPDRIGQPATLKLIRAASPHGAVTIGARPAKDDGRLDATMTLGVLRMPEVFAMSETLRILLRTDDPVRRQGLSAMWRPPATVLVTADPRLWFASCSPARETSTRNRRARHLPDR